MPQCTHPREWPLSCSTRSIGGSSPQSGWKSLAPTYATRLVIAIEHAPLVGRRALALWELYRRGFDTHHIFSVDEFYWEDRPRYYSELDAVRHDGDNLTGWLEYSAEGLSVTLERVWVRIQAAHPATGKKLVLRPKQEQLLRLLSDHDSLSPAEIWKLLQVSRQGAMDLLRPLIESDIVEKVGGKKTGRYSLRKN